MRHAFPGLVPAWLVAVPVALVTGLAVAGCAARPAAPRASVQSCAQFGVGAIRHHVTVTSLPAACRGLTPAQVNLAVDGALHSAAAGSRGKARLRARIARLSHFLQRLVTTVPTPRGTPPAAASSAHPPGRGPLGLSAVGTWLVTVALGLWMLSRWAFGRGQRGPDQRRRAGQVWRLPALNLAHLGLASASLLVWIAYLASGVTAVAWAACVLLPLVAGLGMALLFLPVSDDRPRTRRPPALTLGAHIVFATVTILLAFLTAISAGTHG